MGDTLTDTIGIKVGDILFLSQHRQIISVSSLQTKDEPPYLEGTHKSTSMSTSGAWLPSLTVHAVYISIGWIFNKSDAFTGVPKFIALEQGDAATSQDTLPNPPVPSCCPSPMEVGLQITWQYSSCTMPHVTEACHCVRRTAPHRPVMGMLRYADGHCERVRGPVSPRLGCRTYHGRQDDKWYICCEWIGGSLNCGYMAAATARAPMEGAGGNWLEVPQVGTLEWSFSSQDTFLYYDGIRLDPRYLPQVESDRDT